MTRIFSHKVFFPSNWSIIIIIIININFFLVVYILVFHCTLLSFCCSWPRYSPNVVSIEGHVVLFVLVEEEVVVL